MSKSALHCLGLMIFLLSGCSSYHFGARERSLPGGYDLVAIPVFTNRTHQTGIEVFFTNALIREFERSQVARVVPKSEAQVTIMGRIDDYHDSSVGATTGGSLPPDTSLATGYRIVVNATVEVIRNSDHKVLWTGTLGNETSYSAPQVTIEALNSVDPLYNQSSRDYNISEMAKDMMTEAHDRITENF